MRLLRVSTEDPNAIFQTEFNANINIEPKTQIALQSFIAKISKDEEVIADNTILWGYGNNTLAYNIVPIRNGVFGADNYVELLDNMQLELNNSLSDSTSDYDFKNNGDDWKLGRQMNVSVINGKVAIQNNIAYNDGDVENNFRKQGDIVVSDKTTAPPGGTISVPITAFTSKSYLHNLRSYYPLASGTGYFRVQIRTLDHDVSNTDPDLISEGFMIGLTKKNLSNLNSIQVQPEDVDYAVGVGYDQNLAKFVLYYMDESVRPVNSAIEPESSSGGYNANNSFVQIRLEGKNLHFEYSDGTQAIQNLDTISFDRAEGEDYYPIIVLHGSDDFVELTYPEYTFDPYVFPKTRGTYTKNENFMPRWGGDITTHMDINLNLAEGLGRFLGYDVDLYQANSLKGLDNPKAQVGDNFNFTAENVFKSGRELLNMVLELVNMNVKSYDSSSKQRRNILSTLLSADSNRSVDTIPSLVFIDLDNKEKINLRNITMRLLDQDLNPVKLDGQATATLLLKNIDEK
jgi:hypothetical protein